MSGDLQRYWLAKKKLSIDPGFDEFVRLVSPIDIGGITVQGLKFTMSAHIYSPDMCVTFQMEYESSEFPRGNPFMRLEWKPRSPHNNKGVGPHELRHTPIKGSHVHPFDLNWQHSESQVRRGKLPIAVPVSESLDTYRDALAFAEGCLRIEGVSTLPPPPWTRREWL